MRFVQQVIFILLFCMLTACTIRGGGLPNVFSSYDRDLAKMQPIPEHYHNL